MLHLCRVPIVYFITDIYLFWLVLFYIFTCRVQGSKKLIWDTRLNMIQIFQFHIKYHQIAFTILVRILFREIFVFAWSFI